MTATEWVAGLSPWPEEFGLERMRALLAELGDPQELFPAVHVVGTNGKSTTTRLTAALLRGAGLRVGAYTSPHVSGWHERLDTSPAGFERAVARVRPAAERLAATQFEVLTAAALAEFAEEGVAAAVVEAGLGGRLDATNVLRAPVVVLTNVGLEHTEQLGETRPEIAAEKLAVVRDGATVVLCEPEWQSLARSSGAATTVLTGRSNLALALAAAESLLGDTVDASAADGVSVPGRLDRRSESPLEIWDGAHTVDAVGWLLPRLPDRRYVLVVSILRDKDAEGMLAALSVLGDTVVATASSNARALAAEEVARLSERWFERTETERDPGAALERARSLAGADGAVLVTGSLYLLADLAARAEHVPSGTGRDSASTSSPRS
ncbi:MAG TPA: Mur ligase family protein [Gaiellaceae bacterium]|nr:Mur ligase family protein [Gaiellaceae bacterium]